MFLRCHSSSLSNTFGAYRSQDYYYIVNSCHEVAHSYLQPPLLRTNSWWRSNPARYLDLHCIDPSAMVTDIPPGSWPAAEDVGGGDEVSRPSTMETYVTLEESEESKGSGQQEVKMARSKDKATEGTGKKGVARMPELPPEICET